MKQAWQKLADSINAKVQRERIVIGLLVLSVIYGLMDFTLLAPILKKKQEMSARLDTLQQDMKKLAAQEQVFAFALTNDPHALKKKQIREMELKLKTLENNLQNLSVGLIAASNFPQVLHDVLNSVGSLKLIGMQTKKTSRLSLIAGENQLQVQEIHEAPANLPAEAKRYIDMVEADKHAKPAGETTVTVKHAGVFKHVVLVEIEGSYFDVLAYLQALEQLPWKVYWEGLDYQVTDYPLARVVIEVYTLSTEPGVFGV